MTNKERNSFETRLETEIDKMDARIEELKAKFKKASADAKIKYQQQLNEIEENRDQLKMQLQKLKNSSGEAWQEISNGLEKAANDLKDTVSNVYDKFKG
jgi:Tfp pilus assembly protein PilO